MKIIMLVRIHLPLCVCVCVCVFSQRRNVNVMINAYMFDPFSSIYILGRLRERERREKEREKRREREGEEEYSTKERMESVYNLSLPPEWWVGTSD